jgi:hypothetical protein
MVITNGEYIMGLSEKFLSIKAKSGYEESNKCIIELVSLLRQTYGSAFDRANPNITENGNISEAWQYGLGCYNKYTFLSAAKDLLASPPPTIPKLSYLIPLLKAHKRAKQNETKGTAIVAPSLSSRMLDDQVEKDNQIRDNNNPNWKKNLADSKTVKEKVKVLLTAKYGNVKNIPEKEITLWQSLFKYQAKQAI